MWITLTKKLPTNPSPPRLSIHWATPWPLENRYTRKKVEHKDEFEEFDPDTKIIFLPDDQAIQVKINGVLQKRGYYLSEPDYAGAMRIHYKGEDIRVFPHEFNPVKLENMKLYIYGLPNVSQDTASHHLVPDDSVTTFLKLQMDQDTRDIYGAALLDGCNEYQAQQMLLGNDITDEELEFAPVGWYRCRKEYAEIFCDEREMEE